MLVHAFLLHVLFLFTSGSPSHHFLLRPLTRLQENSRQPAPLFNTIHFLCGTFPMSSTSREFVAHRIFIYFPLTSDLLSHHALPSPLKPLNDKSRQAHNVDFRLSTLSYSLPDLALKHFFLLFTF